MFGVCFTNSDVIKAVNGFAFDMQVIYIEEVQETRLSTFFVLFKYKKFSTEWNPLFGLSRVI